jgi:hypothetical protein
MCKEMPVIPVNKVVDPKRIIGKDGGPRRRESHKGLLTPPKKLTYIFQNVGSFLTYLPTCFKTWTL